MITFALGEATTEDKREIVGCVSCDFQSIFINHVFLGILTYLWRFLTLLLTNRLSDVLKTEVGLLCSSIDFSVPQALISFLSHLLTMFR